jgi:hypothetical protein
MPRTAKKKSRPKSRPKSEAAPTIERPDAGVPRGGLIRQKHGGAIGPGAAAGGRGPAPGTGGRPKSSLREKLRDIFEGRVAVIEQIADGEAIHRTRIRVADLVPYVKFDCANCGADDVGKQMIEATLLRPIDDQYVTIEGTVSASPKDRLAALDLAGKYGPGVVKQVGVEVVREKVVETLDYLRDNLTEADFERVRLGLRSIWVVKAA